MGSADERGWRVEAEGRPYCLHVVLIKREYVLPWVQFLYAEGTEDTVRVVFSTHDVEVQGRGLTSLLADLASQRVVLLREPSRADRFTASTAPQITAVVVRLVEQDTLPKRADEISDQP